ncbi:hypothetical protein L2E82_47928 [Cichorium intybus]|uniref:Uncharacterized protein n=1 Tax=Cichorium intybus TaxID=13427 RepID=A0ACB8YWQ9_CICIN|nr:hypothetical protein L2E82_47928 [Cichorium intybus]
MYSETSTSSLLSEIPSHSTSFGINMRFNLAKVKERESLFEDLQIKLIPPIDLYIWDKNAGHSTQTILNVISVTRDNISKGSGNLRHPSKIWVSTNPRGAERLPQAILASESDLYPRRLYGQPSEDLKSKPNYLLTFTVGYNQRYNIDKAVKKFSDNFTILLFHYDGRTIEWHEFEWSKRAFHISVAKQKKNDLGIDHFNAEEYIKLVRKHKLEISQPGLDPSSKGLTWQMSRRRGDREVHKETEEKPGWCSDSHLPSCAGFVESMAPVFSRESWRCVWHLIQH